VFIALPRLYLDKKLGIATYLETSLLISLQIFL